MPLDRPARPALRRAARPGALLAILALALAAGRVAAASPTGPRATHVAWPGLCSVPVWMADGDQADGRFGTVAPAGDVNGDGYDDVLVGAYNDDHPEADEGVVFLYLGGPGGLASAPAWTAESNQAGARLGDKLSGAGDVNGDGYDDVIVGAALYDSTFTDAGAAFLYLGSPAGLQAEPAWIAIGDQADEQFGACAQAAGDVNGDGFGDVIVGAWLADHGELNEGRAFVYFGSDTGLADGPGWSGESDVLLSAYGYFCASAGDVNGDGFDDLLVGAFRWDNPDLDEGKAMLFLGSAAGLAHAPAWEVEGGLPRNNFGYHLDGAGDVNGDGFADVIVSAPGVDPNNLEFYNAGEATLWLGSATGLSPAPAWTLDGDQDYMAIEAVRGAGDVNGDGFADVAVGSLYHDGAFADAGRAWVFYGCSNGRTAVAPDPRSGVALALAGRNPAERPAFSFTLTRAGHARLAAYDLSGRRVAVLFDGPAPAGTHRVDWPDAARSGASFPAGLYVVRLDAQGVTRRLKVGLLR